VARVQGRVEAGPRPAWTGQSPIPTQDCSSVFLGALGVSAVKWSTRPANPHMVSSTPRGRKQS
jgi:hypothetical protein